MISTRYYNTDACGGIVLSSRDCCSTLHTLSGDDVRGVGVASVSGILTFAFCLPCVLLRASTSAEAVKSAPLG
jgi:hypothetical protein